VSWRSLAREGARVRISGDSSRPKADAATAVDGHAQRICCRLTDHCASQKWQLPQETEGLEGREREKIEVDGLPMTQSQRDGSSTVKREVVRCLRQLRPKTLLGVRQKSRRELKTFGISDYSSLTV
jgi:hypothetical protein